MSCTVGRLILSDLCCGKMLGILFTDSVQKDIFLKMKLLLEALLLCFFVGLSDSLKLKKAYFTCFITLMNPETAWCSCTLKT